MKNRTENISVRYRPQHLTKSRTIAERWLNCGETMVRWLKDEKIETRRGRRRQ